MRPTGRLHLGHYNGVLKHWLQLQLDHECYFFIADWHALTTEYQDPRIIAKSAREMIVDWLAAGIDPGSACIFLQSQVAEHAELHLLLSMIAPLSWLERVPSYKDQREALSDRDLSTYGFLGYPLLQAADILIYKAGQVPVGEDQVAHVELAREIARRFNYLYGREPQFEEKARAAAQKMGKKSGGLYIELRRKYRERGDEEALRKAQALIEGQQNVPLGDRQRLLGYLEGEGLMILPEPQARLTEAARVPGLDGRKMSKSYNNTLGLREPADAVDRKLRTMPTDPARVRRSDPGDPEKCPVWGLHGIYSDERTRQWANEGCRNAAIGCLDCKQQVIQCIQAELEPIRKRAQEYESDPESIQAILAKGRERARLVARDTLREVREAMGLTGYG